MRVASSSATRRVRLSRDDLSMRMDTLLGLAHCSAHCMSIDHVGVKWNACEVSLTGATAWAHQAGAPALIEANVARAPQAKQLQVNAACLLYQPLILLAVPAKQAATPQQRRARDEPSALPQPVGAAWLPGKASTTANNCHAVLQPLAWTVADHS